jgi:hypothetical protein
MTGAPSVKAVWCITAKAAAACIYRSATPSATDASARLNIAGDTFHRSLGQHRFQSGVPKIAGGAVDAILAGRGKPLT